MEVKGITIEATKTVDDLQDFHCGVPTMDKFIHDGLQKSIMHHFCQLYKVLMEGEIVALFALSFDSINLDEDDKEEISSGISAASTPNITFDYEDTFYSKRRYPALDIAYLAVREDMRNKHIGSFLVSQIAKKATEQQFAGCQFLSVEAYKVEKYSAVEFYYKCGFAPNEQPNPNKDTLRMFYTLYPKEQ